MFRDIVFALQSSNPYNIAKLPKDKQQSLAVKRMKGLFDTFIFSMPIQKEVRNIRRTFSIPEDGFEVDDFQRFKNRGPLAWRKVNNLQRRKEFDKSVKELALKFPSQNPIWQSVIKSYIFYDQVTFKKDLEKFIDHDNAVCKIMITEDKLYPVIIKLGALAGLNEIKSFLSDNLSRIESLQTRSLGSLGKKAKTHSRKNYDRDNRIFAMSARRFEMSESDFANWLRGRSSLRGVKKLTNSQIKNIVKKVRDRQLQIDN